MKRAQALGYAEADPSFDLDGIDAAHKLTLLAAMAFGARLEVKQIPTEGIRGLVPIDFEAAREFGYRIKLLAIAKAEPDGEERIQARVQPTMIPANSLLANVDGAMNAIAVTGDAVGPTLFYGAGAGEMPTASAVCRTWWSGAESGAAAGRWRRSRSALSLRERPCPRAALRALPASPSGPRWRARHAGVWRARRRHRIVAQKAGATHGSVPC